MADDMGEKLTKYNAFYDFLKRNSVGAQFLKTAERSSMTAYGSQWFLGGKGRTQGRWKAAPKCFRVNAASGLDISVAMSEGPEADLYAIYGSSSWGNGGAKLLEKSEELHRSGWPLWKSTAFFLADERVYGTNCANLWLRS
ncbi:hypothetical protein C8J57DRAFT_1242839 [Mycena rebaudengoi]|nr:hypothetical protein C8J57DRAFT_1242839 [Mycena rebaudengoi]